MEPQRLPGMVAREQHIHQELAFQVLRLHTPAAVAVVFMAVAQLAQQLKAVATLEHQTAALEMQQP
jgi:hypothetical protein